MSAINETGLPAGNGVTPYNPPPQRMTPQREPNAAPGQEYISLATYWRILRKRYWTILTVALVLTTMVAIGSFRMKPIYKATSRVQVEAETPLIQSLNDLYQKMDTDDAFLQTQIQVLKSESLAWQTIEQLKLGQNSSFIAPEAKGSESPEVRKVKLIGAFQGNLTVSLLPKTRIMTVGFESPDPHLAAQVSTGLVNNYIDYNFRQKYDATRQASGRMEQQLDEIKAKVEKSQQDLVDYERLHSIANTGSNGDVRTKQSIEEQMLSDLSRDLTTAQADRIQKESLYNEVSANRARIAALAHNELLQKLEEKSGDLKGQYLESLAQYGPKFPKAIRLQEQVNENQSQIAQEQNRVIERIHNDYRTAVAREKLAASAVGRQKEVLGSANQLLVQHNILQREFESNQQLYQNLMQHLKDATVSAGLRSTNIHLVDAALSPISPVRPRKLLNISIGLLVGLIFGVMLAFAQESLDHSIKSVEEVESLLGEPALGVIPLRRIPGRVYGLSAHGRGNIKPGLASAVGKGEVGLTIIENPNSILAEAYRSLRTSILLSLPGKAPKTLLITSAQSGEGKTSTALNLAEALAQRKCPVLLVDADMRKPSIAKILKLENTKGLSTVLTGKHKLEDALQQYGPMPNLWVLTAGPIPPNPADLLSSETLIGLLEQFADRFEHVVIDSPPVLAVTDPAILAGLVDGVIIVASGGTTPRGALLRAHKTLASTGARILGVALNKFDSRLQGYYGYGNYYYSYGYGQKHAYGHAPEDKA